MKKDFKKHISILIATTSLAFFSTAHAQGGIYTLAPGGTLLKLNGPILQLPSPSNTPNRSRYSFENLPQVTAIVVEEEAAPKTTHRHRTKHIRHTPKTTDCHCECPEKKNTEEKTPSKNITKQTPIVIPHTPSANAIPSNTEKTETTTLPQTPSEPTTKAPDNTATPNGFPKPEQPKVEQNTSSQTPLGFPTAETKETSTQNTTPPGFPTPDQSSNKNTTPPGFPSLNQESTQHTQSTTPTGFPTPDQSSNKNTTPPGFPSLDDKKTAQPDPTSGFPGLSDAKPKETQAPTGFPTTSKTETATSSPSGFPTLNN